MGGECCHPFACGDWPLSCLHAPCGRRQDRGCWPGSGVPWAGSEGPSGDGARTGRRHHPNGPRPTFGLGAALVLMLGCVSSGTEERRLVLVNAEATGDALERAQNYAAAENVSKLTLVSASKLTSTAVARAVRGREPATDSFWGAAGGGERSKFKIWRVVDPRFRSKSTPRGWNDLPRRVGFSPPACER